MPKLTVVPKTAPGPAEQVRRRLRTTKPAAMLQCPRCAGREIVETRAGALLKDGRVTGGTKQYLCALCLSKGERVVIA